MSSGPYEVQGQHSRSSGDEWQGRYAPARRTGPGATVLGLPLAGLAVVGLGALAWYYLGPDLRRYLKIRSM
jgi:hypothetical protein